MTESIATLGVRVTTSGIKEAERDLKGLTAQGARAEGQADKLGAAWGKRLGVAVLAGTALAGAGIARILKNTIEAERVQAQLAARIKSTGGAAGLAVADLNTMADALQAATTFDDEAIGSAQALLLTFTKIGKDIFPQATEAVLNVSTALGTDLNSAALQVGKALNDPVAGMTALSRAGVQFTASQKDTIKSLVETGRQADAQAIILAELETQMGGSARAARETLGGALQALSNAFDNLLEGDAEGEGIKGTTRAINTLTSTLQAPETKQAFTDLINLAATAANSLAQLTVESTKFAGFTFGIRSKTEVESLKKQITDLDELIENRGDDSFVETYLRKLSASPANPLGFLAKQLGNPRALEIEELQKLRAQVAEDLRAAEAAADSLPTASEILSGGPRVFDGGTTVIRAGEGFGAGKGKSAAAEAAEAEARALAEAIRAAGEAQDQFRTISEDLRAELGGPLAEAQLEYIRREDELIRLATLAGLSSEELADSLGILEAARLRDVDAIKAQIEADRLREKEIAERPLVDRMDSLRDTTAGFFADLVKNGESAIDRLQDYLLNSALESIGKQIAEGLFGGFGTTGEGSAGSGIASFIGQLFAGGRAIGGPVSGGKLYEVGEKGQPEVLNIYGKKYLIPGTNGSVSTVADAPGREMAPIYQTIHVTGTIDPRSSSQIATETARKLSLAQRRA